MGFEGQHLPIWPIYRPFHTLVNRLLPVPRQGPFDQTTADLGRIPNFTVMTEIPAQGR